MRGVHIGDGAVIGANAVITKDVAPFSIVAGVPAKLIKMRFDDGLITKLSNDKWWLLDDSKLRNYFSNNHEIEK